jgi:hypothetical protein
MGIQLGDGLTHRLWRDNIGNVSALDDAVATFNPTKRISGKTIIRVRWWALTTASPIFHLVRREDPAFARAVRSIRVNSLK